MLLFGKIPTQPLLLRATSLFGWQLIKFQSLTCCSGSERSWSRRDKEGFWGLLMGRAGWECDGHLSPGVIDSNHPKCGSEEITAAFTLWRKTQTYVLRIWFQLVTELSGESSLIRFERYKIWEATSSGSVLGTRVQTGVFRSQAVLQARRGRCCLLTVTFEVSRRDRVILFCESDLTYKSKCNYMCSCQM